MKSVLPLLAWLACAAVPALAQDKEAEKKRILEEVEKRLKQDDEQLLKEIEKVLNESLKGQESPTPAEPKKPAPPPPPAAKKARGYLGIMAEPLTEDEKTQLGLKGGLRLKTVVKDGPAAAAGLQVGDVVTGVDGRTLESPNELPGVIQAAGAGSKLKFDLLRDGKKQTVEVTLGRHPEDETPKEDPKGGDLRERVKKFMNKQQQEEQSKPKPDKPPKDDPAPDDGPFALDEEMMQQLRGVMEQFGVDPQQLDGLLEQFLQKGDDGKYRLNDSLKELFKGFDPGQLDPGKFFGEEKPEPKKPAPKGAPKAWAGFYPEELSDELRAQFDLEAGTGLLVADVIAGGPAEKAGLKKSDILLKIDGKPVKGEGSLAKFIESAKPGQETTFTILRKAKEQTLKVVLGERKEE